jgi:trk system potassium uptake protein TrkH
MLNIDFKGILKVVSTILAILSILFIMPIIVGYYYHENIIRFIVFDSLLFITNVGILIYFRKEKISLKIKGAIVVANLTWVLLGVVGAIPYLLYVSDIDFSGGFFEAISGFTTTGATIFSDIESLPKMVLFFRSLTHWLGGMGIIILGVGLLSIINPTGSITLFKAESTGITIDKFAPKIKDTAIMLWGIYVVLTAVDMLTLHGFGMGWFDALNHAFSTISTGGFSTKNNSLGGFNSYIIWTTTIFMVISGINFLAHLRFIHGDLSGYRSEEVIYYLIVFLILAILLSIAHLITDSGISLANSITHSFFTIASIMTTTGFATTDYGAWGHLAVAIIFVPMLIGGNTGSTAGGVKVIRYIVVFKNITSEIKRVLHPNAIFSIFIDGKKMKSSLITSVFGFFTLYIFTTVVVMIYLYARGLDEMSSISTALATVGNIGPGFLKTGPVENYGFFSWYDKIILSFAMIVGRLECYTVFLLLSKWFWKRF